MSPNDTLAEIARLMAMLPHGLCSSVNLGVSDAACDLLASIGAHVNTSIYDDGSAIDGVTLVAGRTRIIAQRPSRDATVEEREREGRAA